MGRIPRGIVDRDSAEQSQMPKEKAATCLTNAKPSANYQYRGGPKM